MEKNGLLKSEYGYFITVKCLQYEVDYYKKVRAHENFSGWISVMFHSSNLSERESDSRQLPLKGSIAKPLINNTAYQCPFKYSVFIIL